MELEPAKSAITTLAATSRLAELKTAQADFEVTYNSKVDSKSLEVYPKIRECRREIAKYSGAMLSYIEVMAELEGSGYSTAVSQIDEVIVEVLALAKTRKTINEKEDTKPS